MIHQLISGSKLCLRQSFALFTSNLRNFSFSQFNSRRNNLENEQINDDYLNDMPDPTLTNPYKKEKKQCILCKYRIQVNYKNTKLISQFVSPYTGRLYDRHITGLCEFQQQVLSEQYYIASKFNLMPSEHRAAKYSKDPRLFDPTKPQRPHPYG